MNLGLSQMRELAVLTLYGRMINSTASLEELMENTLVNRSQLVEIVEHEEISEEKLEAFEKQGIAIEVVNGSVQPRNRFSSKEKKQETIHIPDYLKTLVYGVIDHQEEIDQKLSQYILGLWSIDRLEKINLAILRVATYELLFGSQEQVPALVAINEAIELAKRYSDNRSRKFINGVLSRLYENVKQELSQQE